MMGISQSQSIYSPIGTCLTGTMIVSLSSWNVNGIRAIAKKGFIKWMLREKMDVVCVQETKARREQLRSELTNIDEYHSYFSTPERKGYSGVGIYTLQEPLAVKEGMGIDRFDAEGRILTAEYPEFFLMNVYFPNGKSSKERLEYKMGFYNSFKEFANNHRKSKGVVVAGDFNTAHKELDLARPKENSNVSGFLQDEREWIDGFIESGFTDTFREFDSSPGKYSYWDMRTRARERNVGWRIDYFFVSDELRENLSGADIMDDVTGSDHCPIRLGLKFNN